LRFEKIPPQEDLPTNVSLQLGDILQLFPSQRLNAYDIVHVRFMMYVLKASEWNILARNAMQLLKPGGWLFWEETGYPTWVSLPPSSAEAELLRYDIKWATSVGRDITTPLNLIRSFIDAGYFVARRRIFTRSQSSKRMVAPIR
jgi:hypothetical protein